jgi:hypothetical protein
MAEQFISRGFEGRARDTDRALKERIPPGQYETKEFPVLSAGRTPRTPLEGWDFSIYGEVAKELKWTWGEFQGLPREIVTVDIHCVSKWSKLDPVWTGVSVDTLLAGIDLDAQPAVRYLIAFCDGGYTTNLPLADVRGGEKRGSLTSTTASRSSPCTAARRACSCRTSIFGKARSGCAASNSSVKTGRDSGSRSAITTTATPGKSSDTRVIKGHGAAAQMATRHGGRNPAGDAEGKKA